MRKKSKKKQIVAMTLALSVLSSSVGMCGASAAEALSDTDDSGLQVTVVPLADSNADTDTPADDTTPKEQPVASTGDNTDQPTDGEGDGDNTSSDDKPTIERPEQSETVETLPGTAEDNKDHIKGEDKDDTEDKGDSGEETPGTGDTDTGDTEEKGEEGSGSEETPEEKPEEKPEEDLDYSVAYDQDTGHFKVTFNIKEDAEGDQTVELSKVQNVVNSYGKQAVEEYLASLDHDSDEYRYYENNLYYGWPINCNLPNGLTFSYDPVTETASIVEQPGCTTIFDISLSNGSKHTYVYKDNSLTIATPDMSGKGNTGIEGFDGQELPSDITERELFLSVSMDPTDKGCMETLVDKALKEYGDTNSFRIDSEGNPTKNTSATVPADTQLVELPNGKLYIKAGDYYYGGINPYNSAVGKDENGNYYLKKEKTGVDCYAYDETGKKVYRPVERGGTGALTATPAEIQKALRKYLQNSDTTIEQAVLDYYNSNSDVHYANISDLLAKNADASKDLTKGGVNVSQYITINSSQIYDNFYKNVLSFKVGNQDTVDSEAGGNVDHNHSHGQWATDGTQETIGDYMAGKLDETPGAWAKANAYFNTLLARGMDENEATWVAFAMATNIDASRADNTYQNTAWSWYASMVLHQADGTLDLTKTDKKTGEIIGDDEGEGQTSFYLWKYETDKETGEKDTMYCTYVEPTYTTNEAGEQVLEKDGFYCWVKYDPSKDKLTYTVTTTNGKLNIDYALLENVVYYLQEAIAPDGYDVDPDIYVICDEESYKELEGTEVTNPATGATSKVTESSWLGSILGGKTLSINFMNTATVVPDPDPEPTPDPDPVPPVDPDIPVDPANPDTPPVQDADPDETPVTPENPQNPAVQDAAPDAAALPQTGTTSWMAGVLASLGSLLLACGWFFTRKQYSPKH